MTVTNARTKISLTLPLHHWLRIQTMIVLYQIDFGKDRKKVTDRKQVAKLRRYMNRTRRAFNKALSAARGSQ